MHQRAARRARAAGPLGPGCPTSGRSCVTIPAPRPGQPQQGMALGRRPAPRSPGLSRPACESGPGPADGEHAASAAADAAPGPVFHAWNLAGRLRRPQGKGQAPGAGTGRLRRPRGKGHPSQGTAPGGRAATGRSPGTVPWRGALAVSWRLSRGSPALRHLRAAPHRRLWPKPSSVPGPNRPAQP